MLSKRNYCMSSLKHLAAPVSTECHIHISTKAYIAYFSKRMNYRTSEQYEVLFAEVEMGENFGRQANNMVPSYLRFGRMCPITNDLEDSSRLMEQITLMNLARKGTAMIYI